MARILALTSRLPYPPREGHQLRSFHVLRQLAGAHEVHLLTCLRHDDVLEDAMPLRQMLVGLEPFAIPIDSSRIALGLALAGNIFSRLPFVVEKYTIPALRERLAAIVRKFDLVHVDMLPLMANADCVPAEVPVIMNAHNVEHALLDARIRFERHPARRAFLRVQSPRLRIFETMACQRADAVLACSPTDADQLRALAPDTPVHVVANGVDLDANRPLAGPPRKPSQLIFVGQMGWFPNRDGVEWFLADIFPRILASRPDAHFVLVGKPGGLTIPARLASHVRVAGFVDDVRRPIQDAAVYVVPLRAGSGTRLKVLEAMALGKAIVTTTAGAEGINLEPGREALFADSPAEFAEAVVRLLGAPDDIIRLGQAARARAETSYGWDAIGRELLPMYAALSE